MKVKLFTHHPRGRTGISTRPHTLDLPRELAVEVSRLFYNECEGRTSVHSDTLRAMTKKERQSVVTPRSSRRRATSSRKSAVRAHAAS